MRRPTIVLCLAAVVVTAAPPLQAQTAQTSSQTATSSSCPPTSALDDLIKAVDDAVSGPANKDRTCFRALFLPEKQIKVQTENYVHMAQLWSTYETLGPDGKQTDRGINSIQAVFDGKQWKIFEIIWQAESPTEKVPEKYLP